MATQNKTGNTGRTGGSGRAGRTDWPTILLLLAMYTLLIGSFALWIAAPLPLLVHMALGTLAVHLAFTIWHEAVHRNVSNRTWVNNAVGMIGMLPYMTPYFTQRWMHLRHHARVNEPDDPNAVYLDGSFWTIPLRYPRALGYARKALEADPRKPLERVADLLLPGLVVALYALAWWHGLLLDLVLLWLVPAVFAKLIMDWYINYLPHIGLPPDRYLGTRIVDVGWFTPLVLCHNYHAIHHLWPGIPWHRYPSTFEEKEDHLREHGVPIETRVVSDRCRPAENSLPG